MADTSSNVPLAPSPKPKKNRRHKLVIAGLAALVLLLILLIVPVVNLLVPPLAGTLLTSVAASQSAEWQHAARLLERSCLDCHSPDCNTPFYGGLPVAGALIEQDCRNGVLSLDLYEVFGGVGGEALPEAAIAKLEYVVDQGLMPPSRYVLMHWDRGLGSEEKAKLLTWLRDLRRRHYAADDVAEQFRASPLQPLPLEVEVDAARVTLGNKLFHDVRLSGNDTLSCASCHALDKGGTDQRRTSEGINGAVGPINSPTVFNAVFNVEQFWDGRARDLHEQAGGPVENPIEMGSTFAQVIEKLSRDEALVAEFKTAYADGLTKTNITHAIAEFEKSLVTPNCRFDQYLRGRAEALTSPEREGYELFLANGCATCHVGKGLGGRSFERMGRRGDYFAARGQLTEADHGRYNVTREERDRHVFKVPTLRNIALTYPYFHDGSQTTLEGAVASMARYQTNRSFNEVEVQRVTDFLKTLTGEYQGRMLQ